MASLKLIICFFLSALALANCDITCYDCQNCADNYESQERTCQSFGFIPYTHCYIIINEDSTISRGCARADRCIMVNKNEDNCSVCDDDLCNSAFPLQLSLLLSSVGAIALKYL